MSQNVRSFLALAKASFKMYYRNRSAIIFSLVLPIALMGIFGFLSKGRGNTLKIGLTDHANSVLSVKLLDALHRVESFDVYEGAEDENAVELGKGNIDLQVIIPENFGRMEEGRLASSIIQTRFNKAKPQSGQIANMVLVEIISGLDREVTNTPAVLKVNSVGVTTNDLGFFDFILPGLLSMSIMQLGIFGVAFSFVALKASGALRRIQATPVHPIYFVFAQASVRLLVTLATTTILLICGIYFFGFHMLGSYFSFAFVAVLGILTFLGIGYAIAGWAKDETQVAPVANLIQLPLLLLSGVFFSREGFPTWLRSITDFFPLTYLSHALRTIANEGATLAEIAPDIIGLCVWLVIIYAIAIKLFRWE
jgi:ABC-2 type transport system permease protein